MTRQTFRLRFLPLGLVALLGGCAMYGDNAGSYGRYNGSIGVGVGGYADGYGYGPGWYDGFYYPGSGLWAYDRGGKRHRWQGGDRRGDHRGDPRGVRNDDPRDARPVQPGAGGVGVGVGLGAGVAQGQPRGDGRRGRDDNSRPPQRAPDAARANRPAPQERSPARPNREGRNAQEKPD